MLAPWQDSLSCLFPVTSHEAAGTALGETGRVGPGRLEWPVALVPPEQQAGEGARQLFKRRQGAQLEYRGEMECIRGAVCSFLTQVCRSHTHPQGSWLPSQHPLCGPLAPESLSLSFAPMRIPAVPFAFLDWRGQSCRLRLKPTILGWLLRIVIPSSHWINTHQYRVRF